MKLKHGPNHVPQWVSSEILRIFKNFLLHLYTNPSDNQFDQKVKMNYYFPDYIFFGSVSNSTPYI